MLVGHKEPLQPTNLWCFVAVFILDGRPGSAIHLRADIVRWHSSRWWKGLICSWRLPVTHAMPSCCLSFLPQTFGVPGHTMVPVSITPARPMAWVFIWLRKHLFSSRNHNFLVGSYFSITQSLSGMRNPLEGVVSNFFLEDFSFSGPPTIINKWYPNQGQASLLSNDYEP